MNIQIFYGIQNNKLNVTDICLDRLLKDNIIRIPNGDFSRAAYFGDPLPGILKEIFITKNDVLTKYDNTQYIQINILTSEITSVTHGKSITGQNKLSQIHSQLYIQYGSFSDEYPEQLMAVNYITGSEHILEIGGNIGRNSLVMGYILNRLNNSNLVVLESNPTHAQELTENRRINNLSFHIEPSALSMRKLIQKEWETVPSDTLLPGYNVVNTITYAELLNKYNIAFDTLVLDCEGAFYYILIDMPEILNGINLIIMENDYTDITHKQYVDDKLKQNGFYVDYVESGGWGPCMINFYEVWKRNVITP